MAKKAIAKSNKQSPMKRKSIKQSAKEKVAKKAVGKRKKRVLAIPKNYHSIIPYLIVNQATNAIDFYKKAFAAKEVMRMEQGDKVMYAELKIGDSKMMLGDECPDMNLRSPQAYGGSPMSIHYYVKNVDATVEQAVSAGAKIIKPIENKFYGDRSGMLEDPYGYHWCVSTHIEDVTPARIKKRAAELFGKKQ